MANDYFEHSTPLSRHTTGRAGAVNDLFEGVEAGFDKLPGADALNQGRATYAADTGAADAYVVALPKAPSAYVAGLEFTMKVANPNTGASTVNVNGLGVKPLKRFDGTDLKEGDLLAGMMAKCAYDGTNVRFVGQHGGEAAAAQASADSAASSATAAASSASSASTSATAASTSATNASTSATAAAASETAAAASETAAAASETAAGTSETNAAASAAAASTSETNAASSASAASTSATNAATSETNAGNSATAAATSETNAAASASAASTSATNAAASETAAGASETAAAASAAKADLFANEAHNVEVEPGKFSSFHWSEEAKISATGTLTYRGAWDASTGSFPASPVLGDFYKVSVAGTVDSRVHNVGDSIIYNDGDATLASGWDHIDNSESVTSVFGRVGAIVAGNGDYNAGQITETATKKILTDTERTKLSGIESGATADQTGAEIKTLYEGEANTNAFTDAEKTKLGGIETGATADQTGAEIKTAYEAEADTNAYTDAEKSKLAGVETGATADQTNAEIETAYNAQVSIVSQADAEAGTGTTVRRWTPERVKQAIEALGGGGPEVFESAEQTLTAGSAVSVAHGLSGAPDEVVALLICKTTDLGWAVGDKVAVSGGGNAGNQGVTPYMDNGGLNVGCAMGTKITILHKDGTNNGDITFASWKLILRARKY